MVDLFKLRVPAKQRSPQFESLHGSEDHGRVREYLNQAYSDMGDPNGSFAMDFQGRGFHGRTFELACFCYLRSAGLKIARGFEKPDFMVAKEDLEVAIEVTTSNAPQDGSQDISMVRMENFNYWDDSDDFEFEIPDRFADRMLASLKNKLKRGYQDLPHVAGKPVVLMIAPFFEPGSVFAPDFPLLDILYPTEPDLTVPPFFWLPDATSISAVAYCNSFTIPKFFRLSDPEFLSNECIAIRTGLACIDDPSLSRFRYKIGHEKTPVETWPEGVTLFFNPMATNPLPQDFLPASSRFVCEDGMVTRHVRGFHPFFSRMRSSARKPDEASGRRS